MRPPEQRSFLVLGAILAIVVAGVFTSVATPAPHMGGDNAGYLSLAHALVSGAGYTELWDPNTPAHTKYPPVFPLALGALILSGATGWMAFKLLMAALTSVAVLLVFVWLQRRVGPLAAFAVAVVTVFSSGWLETSRWILSEPAFLAFTFFALWAMEEVEATATGPTHGQGGFSRLSPARWLILGSAGAILAFFTRSAGLPLVMALGASLLAARRVRAFGVFALCLAIPASWWLLRVRTGGEGAYQSEFWMVNPYEPQLGTIGWIELPIRVWANLRLYVGRVLPGEWWFRADGGLLAALGIGLVILATWGWWTRVRTKPATAELFVPLYLGLILLWPEVWSGDRFILPLYPFILLYAGESVARLARPLGKAGVTAVVSAGVLSLLLPALPGWMAIAESASTCRRIAESGDPIRCQGPGFVEFRDAAVWAGANLPEGSVVFNRKPRIHYLFGGPASRTFPFTRDPDEFLAEADRVGARYVLLDHIDSISLIYLPSVISARPLAFCHVMGWGGRGEAPGTDLFGVLPPEERRPGGDLSQLRRCPESYAARPEVRPVVDGRRIPRLTAGAKRSQPLTSP